MTETQRRIRAYKRALPHMKERVIAVALLLAMSISMMSSATFAWMTLSQAPEVVSMTTTIAANGNLEIALSDADGLKPNDTTVTDGGKAVAEKNLTWGNLVNLSDPSYGLDYLVLRPASLNKMSLKTAPVYAVQYGTDGRAKGYINDFGFSVYVQQDKEFKVPEGDAYGVRAISSVTYKNPAGTSWIDNQIQLIDENYRDSLTSFSALYNSDANMRAVANLVGLHANVILGGTDQACSASDYKQLVALVDQFVATMRQIGQTIVEIVNLEYYRNLTDSTQYVPKTFDDLISGKLDSYKAKYPSIPYFKTAWSNTVNADTKIDAVAAKGNIGTAMWEGDQLMNAVNYLCNMDSAKLNGYTASQLAASLGTAAKILFSSNQKATICGGALKEADQLLEGSFYVENDGDIVIEVNYQGINGTLKPDIATDAAAPFKIPTDIAAAKAAASSGSTADRGERYAAETYALAIDFWVRTNAEATALVLEGDFIWEDEKDENGQTIVDDLGNPVQKIVGYGGVNRVWSDLDDPDSEASQFIPDDSISTTQGSGSCYIFYPASPEDQEQSLRLLQAMRVAFIDEAGTLLDTAYMNTANAIEDAGRVIVPLQLRGKQVEVTETIVDEETGEEIEQTVTKTVYNIKNLIQNKPERITAIVYLDGTVLTNSEVLAAGSIKGQLNIQFGTDETEMVALEDKEIMDDYYIFDFNMVKGATSVKEMTFAEYDKDLCKVPVKLSITGDKPTTVKGNFIAYISETQGARQPEFTMTYNSATNLWEATVPFTGPGNYWLRSIQIDGVDHVLTEDQFLHVQIDGTQVNSLTWDIESNHKTVFTAQPYHQQTIDLTLNTNNNNGEEKTIPKVQAVFIGKDTNVTINMTSTDGTNYRGTGNFTNSGDYTLTYVYIDGVVTPLTENMCKEISMNLGLRTEVYIAQPVIMEQGDLAYTDVVQDLTGDISTGWNFVYKDPSKALSYDVYCYLYDDQGSQITGDMVNALMLYYGIGSDTDALSSPLEWNDDLDRYEGEFHFNASGTAKFNRLVVNSANEVTNATVSPTLTAIPPVEMKYVSQKGQVEPVVYQLGMPADERTLAVKLKDAPAALLEITVEDEDGKKTVYSGITASADADGNNCFYVELPSDGKYTITSAKASQVFYNDTYYSGGENVLDLNELDLDGDGQADNVITNDNISTYYLTEATLAFSGSYPLDTYSGEFMSITGNSVSPENDPMVVSLVDHTGGPLEATLKSLGINEEVTIDLEYVFTQADYYRITSDVKIDQNFGVKERDANGTIKMEPMTFRLAGTFTPVWTVTIGDDTYSYTAGSGQTLPTEFTVNDGPLTKQIEVAWSRPKVEFVSVEPSSITINKGSLGGKNTASFTNRIEGNLCYANLNAQTIWGRVSGYDETYVTTSITNAGSFTSASMLFDGSEIDVTFEYTPQALSSRKEVGDFSWGKRYTLGDVSTNKLTLKYTENNIVYSFEFTLVTTLRIVQQY